MFPSRQKRRALWKEAIDGMSNGEKKELSFGPVDDDEIANKLLQIVEEKKAESVRKQWGYTRSSGEHVTLRQVFEKINEWLNLFKDVGDVVVQYDPVHAALPWAGVRFLLQVSWHLYLSCRGTLTKTLTCYPGLD